MQQEGEVLEVVDGIEYVVLREDLKESTLECIKDVWHSEHVFYRTQPLEVLANIAKEWVQEAATQEPPLCVVAVDRSKGDRRVIGFSMFRDWTTKLEKGSYPENAPEIQKHWLSFLYSLDEDFLHKQSSEFFRPGLCLKDIAGGLRVEYSNRKVKVLRRMLDWNQRVGERFGYQWKFLLATHPKLVLHAKSSTEIEVVAEKRLDSYQVDGKNPLKPTIQAESVVLTVTKIPSGEPAFRFVGLNAKL